jgi:hypothetical protein
VFPETSRLVSGNKPACFRKHRKQAGLFQETSRLVSGSELKQAGLIQLRN